MAISVVCEACGKRFGAPEAFAGKQVRCRGCGTTLTIPGGEAEMGFQDERADATPAQGPLQEPTPPSDNDSEGTKSGQPALVQMGAPDDRHEEAPPPPRERKLRAFYGNPYVRMVDQWLPLGSCVVGLIWTALSIAGQRVAQTSDTIPTWIAGTRLGVIAVLYAGVMFPLALLGLKVAANSINLPLPSNARWKLFASYVPSVCLAIAIWNAGDGATPALVFGAILGLVVSSAFMTILFRLEVEEIPLVAGHTGGGFFLGAVLSALAMFAMNLMTVSTLVKSKSATPPPTSPFWSGFEWETRVPEMRLTAPTPAKKPTVPKSDAKSTPDTGTKPPVNVPGTGNPPAPPVKPKSSQERQIEKTLLMPISGSDDTVPLLGSGDKRVVMSEVGDAFDGAIRPITPSNLVALARKARAVCIVEVRDERNISAVRGRAFEMPADSTLPLQDQYALSPDGGTIGCIVSFPVLKIIAHGTDTGLDRDLALIDEGSQHAFKLIGFAGPNKLLWRYDVDKTNNTVIRVLDTTKPDSVVQITLTYELDALGGSHAVDPTGRILAIVDNGKNLHLYDIATGREIGTPWNFGPVRVASAETAPSGLAFSPDGKSLAAYYDFGDRTILRSFNADEPHARQIERAFPSNPIPKGDQTDFQGNKLAWWPSGKGWMIYGDAAFDPSGLLGRVAIEKVTSQHFIDDHTLDLVAVGSDHKRRLIRVTLDLPPAPGH